MKRSFFPLVLILLAALAAFSGCARGPAQASRIGEFTVDDIPNDEGSGITLRWQTLDKSQRVIQYNIYRGHNPDSLFYLSKIEVDPDVGVVGGWLNFTDQGYNTLIEFETAPASLKTEKIKAGGATLFKAVPRDPDVLEKLLPHYDVLGDINSKKFFGQASRIEHRSAEGTEVFAGFKLTSFNNIYAAVKPEHPYYYSVVPVAENGSLLPATQVRSAVPVNNRPDSTAVFYASYLQDTREFRFEWVPPLGGSDIASWQAWLMPKSLLPRFHADQKANHSAPDSVFNASWQEGSILIGELPVNYYGQNIYSKASADSMETPLPPANELSGYVPVLAYEDYWASESAEGSYKSASLGRDLVLAESSLLPKLPDYQVLDKTNDKGDNIVISFGRPFAFVSQASYANNAKTRLRINYDIADNGHHKISKLRFRFFEPDGSKLGEVVETYTDKIIHLRLPQGRETGQAFRAEISVWLQGENGFSSESVSQAVQYDPSSLRFLGGELSSRGQVLNTIYYDIFSANRLSDFTPGMRIGALSRAYDHNIPYPSTENPVILGVDHKTKLLLCDHTFTVALDPETQATFSPSLFADETLNHLEDLARQIDASFAASQGTGPEAETAGAELEALRNEQSFILSHPAFKKGLQTGSDAEWRKLMRAELDQNSRAYAYKLLATDGQGLWSDEGDLPQTGPGAPAQPSYLHPKSEWFDTTKWATLIASIIMGIMVVYALFMARRKDLYIRPIAGLQELDNAVGRATEMGRPVMFVPGWGTLGEPCTISAMMILNQIARKTAEYDIRLISPQVDYLVLPLAQEMVQTAYNETGRPDAFQQDDIYFVSDTQFAFTAAVNGITVREQVATIFYMGYFFAEALLMTETGNQAGAIQIAGSDAITQIPFFITTCDYTLIGEEFYAASAYLSRNIELVAMLKAQDYFKLLIVICVLIGTVISTLGINAFLNFLPIE